MIFLIIKIFINLFNKMDLQVVYFNNVNQIIFDYTHLYHYEMMNNMKEYYFDKFNDTKKVISSYDNLYDFDVEVQNPFILIDMITYNKLNITKFNIY